MTEIIFGLTLMFLGGCFILQQRQLVILRKIVNSHQALIDHTVRQQGLMIRMMEIVPGNPDVKRNVRIPDDS